MKGHLRRILRSLAGTDDAIEEALRRDQQPSALPTEQEIDPIRKMMRWNGNRFLPLGPAPSTGEAFRTEPDQHHTIELLSGTSVTIPMWDYLLRDRSPLPPTEDREGYAPGDERDYWLMGLEDYIKLKHLLPASERGKALRVLDFGCSSGRFVRHLLAHEPRWDVYACDIDPGHIEWINTNLGGAIQAFASTIFPSLPIPDDHFDVICAFSVFTHIDMLADAWLLELRRVLRPGGVLYLTLHTERVWRRIANRPEVMEFLMGCNPRISTPEGISPTKESFEGAMPFEFFVLRLGDGGTYTAQVFQSIEYTKCRWGRFFHVDAIHDAHHHHFQDVAILKKVV